VVKIHATLSTWYRIGSGTSDGDQPFSMCVSGALSVVSGCSQEYMTHLSEAEVTSKRLLLDRSRLHLL